MTAVVVTGGREYSDARRVNECLDWLHAAVNITLLVQGGAQGADALAARWARDHLPKERSVTVEAEWTRYGKSAGMRRNQEMLQRHKPHLVFAFPGGRGTANCVFEAEARRIPVLLERHCPKYNVQLPRPRLGEQLDAGVMQCWTELPAGWWTKRARNLETEEKTRWTRPAPSRPGVIITFPGPRTRS